FEVEGEGWFGWPVRRPASAGACRDSGEGPGRADLRAASRGGRGAAACELSGGTAWHPDCRARPPAGRLGPNIRLVPRIRLRPRGRLKFLPRRFGRNQV